MSASRHVTEIHLSDLLPRHLDLLQRWLDGEEREHAVAKYVMGKENDGYCYLLAHFMLNNEFQGPVCKHLDHKTPIVSKHLLDIT